MKLKDLNFTDLKLLKVIQEEYFEEYLIRVKNAESSGEKKFIPIDCNLVAKKLGLENGEFIFQRLKIHLQERYGYKTIETTGGKIEEPFFSMAAGKERNCINYPYLCAVVADLRDEQEQLTTTRRIAITSVGVAFIMPFIVPMMSKDIVTSTILIALIMFFVVYIVWRVK